MVLIVIGLLLIPIGVKTILGINKTANGIVAGSTTELIVDNIVPLALVGILMALIYGTRKKGGK